MNSILLDLGGTHLRLALLENYQIKKMEVFDATGVSLGYVPIYDAIT